jgi:hypothetical protein
MTSTLWAQRGSNGTGVYYSEDDALHARGFNSAAEVKCFRNKRNAEAWIEENAQRPTKRPRTVAPVRIVCDGVSINENDGAVGVYFGPDDSRNVGARIVGWYDDLDNVHRVFPVYASACAVYAAVKRAPPEGKVIIETSCRFVVSYVQRITLGRHPNWAADPVIMSIKNLLHLSNRRISLVFVARSKSVTVQKATDLAFAALEGALHVTFPTFPLKEDIVQPWVDSHFDDD